MKVRRTGRAWLYGLFLASIIVAIFAARYLQTGG
jgi:hypothetical protein